MTGISDVVTTITNTNTLIAKLNQVLSSGLPGLISGGIPLTGLTQISGQTLLGNASTVSGNVSQLTLDQIFPMLGLQLPPQGRLTLSSGTPVMTADVSAASTVYYAPYVGNIAPIFDSVAFNLKTFPQLTMTLASGSNVSGGIYDGFLFESSGTLTIGTGPAWTNASTRSNALIQVSGLWVNSGSITLNNGASTYTGVSANQATYVGTVYCTSAGLTAMQFKPTAVTGGSNPVLGLYNAYNRINTSSTSRDNNANWTGASATWLPADRSATGGGLNNRVTWIDGLGQSRVFARYTVIVSPGNTGNVAVGVLFNATSGTPGGLVGQSYGGLTSTDLSPVSGDDDQVAIGLNYAQAMESEAGAVTATFGGNANGYNAQSLKVLLEM